jgi:hypothetical protein
MANEHKRIAVPSSERPSLSLFEKPDRSTPPPFRSPEEIEERFTKLANEWHKAIGFTSTAQEMAVHPAYQQIIGLGDRVVPLILRELERRLDHWFWALYATTGDNPVSEDDAGNMERMRSAWLDYGRKRGYI